MNSFTMNNTEGARHKRVGSKGVWRRGSGLLLAGEARKHSYKTEDTHGAPVASGLSGGGDAGLDIHRPGDS